MYQMLKQFSYPIIDDYGIRGNCFETNLSSIKFFFLVKKGLDFPLSGSHNNIAEVSEDINWENIELISQFLRNSGLPTCKLTPRSSSNSLEISLQK